MNDHPRVITDHCTIDENSCVHGEKEMSNTNPEPSYMARTESEYEKEANYSHELTRVVMYSTYIELLDKLKRTEEDLQDSKATIQRLVEKLERVKAGWIACNAKLNQVEAELASHQEGWKEVLALLDDEDSATKTEARIWVIANNLVKST